MQPEVWRLCSPKLHQTAVKLRACLPRDAPCQFGGKLVHLQSGFQCPVLFQISLAHVRATIGHQQEYTPESMQKASRSFEGARWLTLLEDGPGLQEADARRQCIQATCLECTRLGTHVQINDVQPWMKHAKKHHKKQWQKLALEVDGTLIRESRPCAHCLQHFHKMPAAHAKKCLPVLQLAFAKAFKLSEVGVFSHGRCTDARATNRQCLADVQSAQPKPCRRACTKVTSNSPPAEVPLVQEEGPQGQGHFEARSQTKQRSDRRCKCSGASKQESVRHDGEAIAHTETHIFCLAQRGSSPDIRSRHILHPFLQGGSRTRDPGTTSSSHGCVETPIAQL